MHVFKAAVERAKADVNLVEEIQVGNVLPPGGGATVARMAQLAGESQFVPRGLRLIRLADSANRNLAQPDSPTRRPSAPSTANAPRVCRQSTTLPCKLLQARLTAVSAQVSSR